MAVEDDNRTVRVLCPKLAIVKNEPNLQWLIGSPFFTPLTIVSTFKCIHSLPSTSDFASPDYSKESEDLRTLILRGFHVIGALITRSPDLKENAGKAVDAVRNLRKFLYGDDFGGKFDRQLLIGGAVDSNTGDIHFYFSRLENSTSLESVRCVVYEDHPEKYVWETGCLLRCELPIKLPIFYPVKNPHDAEKRYLHAIEAVITKFKDPQVIYTVETVRETSVEVSQPVIFRGSQLDFNTNLSEVELQGETAQNSHAKMLPCAHFCLKSLPDPPTYSAENADTIQVSLLFNKSKNAEAAAPVAEYLPALEEARLFIVDLKLEVLCYAAKDFAVKYAISQLIIPGMIDQLKTMKNTILRSLLGHHPQLRPYHFSPPGVSHPITVIYELNYGETEMKQVEVRRSLHLRLGLPFDRPLLRIANALDLSSTKDSTKGNSLRKGSPLLKDVHIGIPSSGVSGGLASLVQGSYEYHHYLQDGIDDSVWEGHNLGRAFHNYKDVFRRKIQSGLTNKMLREIQQSLVDVGDKDPSFIGSREWIGAIELSFVLDKLLGVSCKVINVRSGAELPERCRELALHFENQGTPIMIGGGVLAYTLLGVDYNEASGDCAFLILDPHYTGSDDLKKIVNGGWCGWKNAVDSKGKNFFLQDKFYNLLLPQRPNMV